MYVCARVCVCYALACFSAAAAAATGCGLLMSVAYLDPGNLEADIGVGQHAGYTLLWFFLLTNMCFVSVFGPLRVRYG